MPEFMFVLKAFLISLLLTVFLQMKVGNDTLENQAHDWIQTSAIPMYLQKVASGGVLALQNAGKTATAFVSKNFGHEPSQKAGRMNIELKRSDKYEQENNK